jgi:hypothetical protein
MTALSPPDQPKPANEASGGFDAMRTPKDRTVAEFQSAAEALADALRAVDVDGEKDWIIKNFDEETTKADPNDIKDEVDRLVVLKSYNILDTKKESEFDILTDKAKKYFSCPPIAVVCCLVDDVGRQWVKYMFKVCLRS